MVGLPAVAPWSARAVAHWCLCWVLAAGLGLTMVFGPLWADFSWGHEVHVTPAQAALHFALRDFGLGHHHGSAPTTSAATAAAAPDDAVARPGSSGAGFSPAGNQALPFVLPRPPAALSALARPEDQARP